MLQKYSYLCLTTILSLSMPVFAQINTVKIKTSVKADIKALKKKDGGKKYTLESAQVSVNSSPFQNATVKLRGQTCLSEIRKCFGVNLENEVSLFREGKSNWETENFNLASMYNDRGYINNKMAQEMAKTLKISDLKNTYANVIVNDVDWGLYFAVQKVSKDLKDSPWIGRRRSDDNMETDECRQKTINLVNPNMTCKFAGPSTPKLEEGREFHVQYQKILTLAKTQIQLLEKGMTGNSNLYQELSELMDIDGYFRLLAMNSLFKNGDYTDEVFFYADPKVWLNSGKIYFKVYPWDFEDLFADKPHDDPKNDQAKKEGLFSKTVLYSFEDSLDIAIGKDQRLYSQFKRVATAMLMDEANEQEIDRVIEAVRSQITPYLSNPNVFIQMENDQTGDGTLTRASDIVGTNGSALLEKRRKELKARRLEILSKISH